MGRWRRGCVPLRHRGGTAAAPRRRRLPAPQPLLRHPRAARCAEALPAPGQDGHHRGSRGPAQHAGRPPARLLRGRTRLQGEGRAVLPQVFPGAPQPAQGCHAHAVHHRPGAGDPHQGRQGHPVACQEIFRRAAGRQHPLRPAPGGDADHHGLPPGAPERD